MTYLIWKKVNWAIQNKKSFWHETIL